MNPKILDSIDLVSGPGQLVGLKYNKNFNDSLNSIDYNQVLIITFT